MLRGDVTITTIDLSCVQIMSVKLHSRYRILWASLCASFALFSQKLREWQHLSAYFLNTPRTLHKIVIVSMHLGVNTSTHISIVDISQHTLHKIVTVSMHLGVNISTQLSTVHDRIDISQHTQHETVTVSMHLGINTSTQHSTVHNRMMTHLDVHTLHEKETVSMHLGVNTPTQLSTALIMTRKRELVALLKLSS